MKKKLTLSIVIIALSFLTYIDSCAQSSRFNAGIVAGLNFAELVGDGIGDYFGFNTGILGAAKLSRHSQVGLEILFSQNGEYILPAYYPPLSYGQVWLNHIEVPIHLDWLIGVFERENFYDWNLNIGIAYTRLIGYNIKSIDKNDVSDQVVYENKEALLVQAGTTYHFTKNIGLNFKASLPIRTEGLSWTLATRLIYII
ncbi:MAG TPA: hypothetical protein PKJ83_18315 [Cyclobacteriaceae bacterium]|nr:hypothetical protein [Cyclobacteriaceae bacterium]